MSRGVPPSPFCSHARSAALVRTRQWRTVMLGFSDLDVGITVGEFLMGCFFVAVVWRLFVGSTDRGADALRRDGGRRLY